MLCILNLFQDLTVFISIDKLSYISDTDNDGYLIASSINTSGELLDRNSSLERTDVSPLLNRFDVITEEEYELPTLKKPILT